MVSVQKCARHRAGGLLIALATVVCVACSSGGGTTLGSTTQPSPAPAPGTGSGATADVNGTWSGSATDSSGGGSMAWQLTQSGTSFSGTVTVTDTVTGLTAQGTVSGTISGSSVRYSIAIPAGGFESAASCTASASGDGQVSSSAITGVYTGSNSCTGAISSGQFTLNKQ